VSTIMLREEMQKSDERVEESCFGAGAMEEEDSSKARCRMQNKATEADV